MPGDGFWRNLPQKVHRNEKKFLQKFWTSNVIIFGGGAKMCSFNFIFYFFDKCSLKYDVFLDKFCEVGGIANFFFKIFQSFFVEWWCFENFEQPFCKKISKVQPPFFFIYNMLFSLNYTIKILTGWSWSNIVKNK